MKKWKPIVATIVCAFLMQGCALATLPLSYVAGKARCTSAAKKVANWPKSEQRQFLASKGCLNEASAVK